MKFHMLHPADRIVMIMSRLYDYGMTTTSGGNISIRDEDGVIWITPGSTDKGDLRREDIVRIMPDGSFEGIHKPSSEYPFHLAIYKCRPDINAVLHAHPSALSAFSLFGKIPNMSLVPDASYICGQVAMSEYAVPGSELLGEKITREFARGYNSVMMANHGVVVGADDLFEAFIMFETLNYCAMLERNANRLTKTPPKELSDKHIAAYRLKTSVILEDFITSSYSSDELDVRREMCRFINRAYDHGLFSSTQGTLSTRMPDGSIIVTPYAYDRKYLAPEDLVLVKDNKKEKGKHPSRSVVLCNEIYKNNPDINSIMIARPPHIMAFAITDAEFSTRTIPESYAVLRDVMKFPFGSAVMQPGLLAKELTKDSPVCLIENDCAIVCGKTQLQAFDRLEVLEHTAKVLTDAIEMGGNIVSFNCNEIEDIKKAFGII